MIVSQFARLTTPCALPHGLRHRIQGLAHLRITNAVVGTHQFHGLALGHRVIRERGHRGEDERAAPGSFFGVICATVVGNRETPP